METKVLFMHPELSGPSRSRRQIELEQSYKRSHAARMSHRIRKQKTLTIQNRLQRGRHNSEEGDRDQKPRSIDLSRGCTSSVRYISFYPGDTACEARSLAFFRERTAMEWSGWEDAEFWSEFITQVSFVSSALRHALMGLAACHESLEATCPDRKNSLQQMGIIQGQKALTCLNQQYANLSTSAIVATYIAISAFAARLHPGAYAYIISLQYEFYDQLKTSRVGSLDEAYIRCYIDPIIERQSSRSAHFLDLSWNLARTPAKYFKPTANVLVPNAFSDLKHARDSLEMVLFLATYEAKVQGNSTQKFSPTTALLLQQWYESLQVYRDSKNLSEESKQSLKVLRAFARINIIMIQTMDAKTEMVFDEYLDAYNELANTFEEFIQFEKKNRRTAINFGTDGCFGTLIGHTAIRWCREPSIRRKIIHLLAECNRVEGFESAGTWARVADHIREIEEDGIFPPPISCNEIPAENRVRIVRSLFYFDSNLLQICYVRPSLQKDEAEEPEVRWLGDSRNFSQLTETYPFGEKQFALEPDLDVGRDYFTWQDKRTNTYHTTRGSNFYFPLPRC